MIGFWTIHAVKGGIPQGIKTLESGGYIVFHMTAESLTGLLCLTSGVALGLDIPWSMSLALLSSGMLIYTSINSLAWREVKNKPVLSLMFIIPAIIALASAIYLLINI